MTIQNNNAWIRRAGTGASGTWSTVIDQALPGWAHTGLRVGTIEPGERLQLDASGVERIIVPLAGSFQVSYGPEAAVVDLLGRRSVFDGPSDVLYLGAFCAATITGTGRVAVAEAPTATVLAAQYLPASEVAVELRGAGASSRQVHNFGVPGAIDAVKLIVCEVITPAGNWSSYPPHKHDEHREGHESALEEIYYFESEVMRGADVTGCVDPFGLFSTYSSPAGEIDINAQVRSGDIALVPFGFHGPAVAPPGYDLYYLNVMAGPGSERVWHISDDQAHAWVRDSWATQGVDPRLPYNFAVKGQGQ